MPESKQNLFSNIGTILAYTTAGALDPSSLIKMQEQARQNDLERARLNMQMQENESQARLRNAQIKMYENGVPLITMGMDGSPSVVGTIPKGSVVRQSPEALLALATAKSELPTADMKNNLKTAEQAEVLISDLKQQASSLKGGYEGLGKQAEAFVTRGAGDSGNYKMYEDLSKSAAVAFYRAVTGDTRLSDQDASSRAYPLMWKTNEDVSLRDKKFSFLENMIQARKKLLSSGKYKDGVIPLDVLKKEAQSIKGSDIPSFSNEDDAIKAGVKGIVIINGRKARID